MFRFTSQQWKERGTGELKMLQHLKTGKIRILMRRDQTLKVCANHLISSEMELKPNVSSDRSWVYTALGDACEDSEPAEQLAIRFGSSENANAFKAKFIEAQSINKNPTASADVSSLDVSSLKVSDTAAPAADGVDKSESKTESGEDIKEEVKEEVKDEVKEEVKDEVKEEVKDEVKEEVKDEVKEEKESNDTNDTKEEENKENKESN